MSLNISIALATRSALVMLLAIALPAAAAWQLVASEPGKRVEIDRDSIVADGSGESVAKGRIVLDKPVVDPKTSVPYRIIEVVNRFDCAERTHATLKRSYYKEEGDLLRQEEVRNPFDMPVRSGTPDDKLLREVCRPKNAVAISDAGKTVDKVDAAAGDLRKLNEAMIDKEVKRDVQRLNSRAKLALSGKSGGAAASSPAAHAEVRWSYAGEGGAEHWSQLKPEYAVCAIGRRQSPIDIRDGIAVDLEPIRFAYQPAPFRVSDSGRNLQLAVHGGSFALLGKNYELVRLQFHRPAEMTVAGKTFEMDAQLVHKGEDGKVAIVTVLFEKGSENALVQQALNNLPLDPGGEVAPPAQKIDLSTLIGENDRYYSFMGSLTAPPCSEDVLWLVLKKPQPISAEQLAIFARLYPPNARPVQPGYDRIIKDSRRSDPRCVPSGRLSAAVRRNRPEAPSFRETSLGPLAWLLITAVTGQISAPMNAWCR